MIRTARLAVALLIAPPVAAAAQQPPRAAAATAGITAREIDGHLRFLSHDLLEGRAPATRGSAIAVQISGRGARGSGRGAMVDRRV